MALPSVAVPPTSTDSKQHRGQLANAINALSGQFGGGPWTPIDASGGTGTGFIGAVGLWRKVPGLAIAWGSFTMPTNSDSHAFKIGGLLTTPVASSILASRYISGSVEFGGGGGAPGGSPNWVFTSPGLLTLSAAYLGGTPMLNSDASSYSVNFSVYYPI